METAILTTISPGETDGLGVTPQRSHPARESRLHDRGGRRRSSWGALSSATSRVQNPYGRDDMASGAQ